MVQVFCDVVYLEGLVVPRVLYWFCSNEVRFLKKEKIIRNINFMHFTHYETKQHRIWKSPNTPPKVQVITLIILVTWLEECPVTFLRSSRVCLKYSVKQV